MKGRTADNGTIGYRIECDLAEPGLPLWEVQQAAITQQRFDASYLDEYDTTHWIASFKKHMTIQSTIIPHDAQLLQLANSVQQAMKRQSELALAPTIAQCGIPMVRAALLLGVLSMGALCLGDYAKSRTLFEESRKLVDNYPGEPTFDLCAVVHLHHVYILTTGTSNGARALAHFNVQIAHDLGMNQKHGTPASLESLRLYLLIVISDQ